MERPIFKPVGTPVEQLDTPALVVDLGLLESNIEVMHAFFRQRAAKIRPDMESHRCPAIAHKQLAAGATVGGICVSTVGQAQVFAESGVADILIANEIVSPQKIGRLCALARQVQITVAVDQTQNVQDLSQAAQGADVMLQVVIDIHTRGSGCGVEPGQPALDLAKAVQRASHVRLAGLITREGPGPTDEPGKLAAESRPLIQRVLDTRQLLEHAGLEVHMVGVGGTYNYELAGTMPGVTDVLAGTYALMDARYAQACRQFTPAARVLATVTSRPEPGTAIVDTGQKAIGIDTGLPLVDGIAGATAVSLSAEHGRLRLPSEMEHAVAVTDKIWLTPWDIGACVNLYDYIHAARNGKLEVVWDVAARGRYR